MIEKRDGYEFGGFYLDPEFTKKINPAASLVSTTALFAKWTPVEYPVTYLLEEGENSPYNPPFITVESGVVKLFPARCEGKVFQGWYWSGKKVAYLPEKTTGEIVLEGRFVKLPVVHFHTNAPMKIADQICLENGRLQQLPTPMKVGSRFQGWFLDEQFNIPLEADFCFVDDTELYGKWELMEYKISFDPDGGVLDRPFPSAYTVASKSALLPTASKEGFRFAGWKDPRGNTVLILRKGTIGVQQFKASWKPEPQEVVIADSAAQQEDLQDLEKPDKE